VNTLSTAQFPAQLDAITVKVQQLHTVTIMYPFTIQEMLKMFPVSSDTFFKSSKDILAHMV
jgi:hypothetical protein